MAVIDLKGERVFTILPLLARIATPAVDTFLIRRASGMIVVIETTAIAATPSVVVTLQGLDQVAGVTFDLIDAAAITSVSTRVLRVNVGLPASPTVARDMVPPVFTLAAVHDDADSITYSIVAMLTD